jgi:hypothetical protein
LLSWLAVGTGGARCGGGGVARGAALLGIATGGERPTPFVVVEEVVGCAARICCEARGLGAACTSGVGGVTV